MKRFVLAAIIMAGLIGCANSMDNIKKEMNAHLDHLTYEEALIKWGQPDGCQETKKSKICSWTSDHSAFVAYGYVAKKVQHGERLTLVFDHENLLLRRWRYDRW